MKTDVRLYTVRHIAEQLALLEEHLKEFSQGEEEVFCLDCQLKHLLLLNGYISECVGFQCKPEGLIKEIKEWAEDLTDKLTELKREKALKIVDQARDFRKQLEKQLIKPKDYKAAQHLK